MRKILLTILFVFLTVARALTQEPAPSQTPPPSDDSDVVKISTNLIQIDVTVMDKKGNPVSDIRPEELEVFENGKKQEITNFSYVSAGVRSSTAAVKPAKADKNAVLPPPQKMRAEQVRRTIALVVDDLTLSFTSTYYVRRALRKFVDEQMEEGDLVAIIRTGAGIGALQQFTTDKRLLYAAIEKIKWNAHGGGGIGAFAPFSSFATDQPVDPEAVPEESLDSPDADLNEFRESVFATGTLGAINYIIGGMKDLPGRKSVMLLSDGFSLFTRSPEGLLGSSPVLDALRNLVDLANRSSVVIYTIDARGLVVIGITAEDDVSRLSGEQIERQLAGRRDKLFDTQDGLNYLARQTGGFPVFNNNDISGGIRKVLDDQSYYLVAYQPDDETFDAANRRFNKLEVRVNRKDVKVRYRSGFFGVNDRAVSSPANLTPAQQIFNALASPFGVSGINLSLNTVFRADSNYGTYLSTFLYIDTKDLKFSDGPDGAKKAVFDLVAFTFGDNGLAVDQISKTYTFNLSPTEYRILLNNGFIYFFSFPIAKPGAYQMRVAIRDHGSEKIGSASQFIEVPALKKKRLTISGVVLQNLTMEEWENEGKAVPAVPRSTGKSTPMADTAIRKFKRGSVLSYGFEIYNAKDGAVQNARLQMQTRVFRDGKLIFEGSRLPVSFEGQTDPRVIKAASALALGTVMTAGDYVLQIIVTDELAKRKYATATQFVQFEVIE